MSLGGIIIFGGKKKKIMEFSTRFVIGWLNLSEHNDWPDMISGRMFYTWGGTGNVSGRNYNFWRENIKNSGNFH